MPRTRNMLSMLAFTLVFSSAPCSSQAKPAPALGAPAPQAPGSFGEKKSASYIMRLSSSPTPPIRGLGTLEALVTDAQGRPVDDAQVSFDLDMTTMSHGKNIVVATPQGNGRYVGQVRFMMPGPWRVILVVARPGRAAEQARFDFGVNFR
jgi:hypothetical protein